MIVCEAGSPNRIVDMLVICQLVPNPKDIEAGLEAHAASILTDQEQALVGAALRKYLHGTDSESVFERRFGVERPA